MNLPTQEYRVVDFCTEAERLLEEAQITKINHKFINFVLTGVHDDRQAVVNPILNQIPAVDFDQLTINRDYDSLLGIDAQIHVQHPLTLYMMGKKEDILTSNIHLTHSWGSNTVPVHKIPNICLGKWSSHSLLRVLIPDLYQVSGDSCRAISQANLAIFYDQGLYPALKRVMGSAGDDIPATYNAEMWRARKRNGQLSAQTKLLDADMIPNLADAIRDQLNIQGVPWAENMVFLHQVRGVKNTTIHEYNNPDDIHSKLLKFLHHNGLEYEDLMASGYWCVDVGMEVVSSTGQCLAWRTDGHCSIVQEILQINEVRAEEVTSIGSSKYTRDMASHLTKVSGCRITPGGRSEGPYHARYLQLYHTDKNATANKEGFHSGKFLTGSDVLQGKAIDWIEKVYTLYLSNAHNTQSHARAEVRVKLEYYDRPFRTFSTELVGHALVSFSTRVWWSLRAYRALACQYLLKEIEDALPRYRYKNHTILLLAFAPWFLNSLHATPDLGPSQRDMLTATLPHIKKAGADVNILAFKVSTRSREDDSDSDDGSGSDLVMDDDEDSDDNMQDGPLHVKPKYNTAPSIIHGLVFLRPMRIGSSFPCPRLFDHQVFLKDKTVEHIFDKSLEKIQSLSAGISSLSMPTNRVANKKKVTPRYVPQEDNHRILFRLEEKGFKLAPPVVDAGSDLDSEDGDNEVFPPMTSLNEATTRIWRQFLLDITNKSPNPRSYTQPSYCKLTDGEREMVNETTYKNNVLSDYFWDCQWKIGTVKHWETSFNHLFPDKGGIAAKLKGNVQNYKNCQYLSDWARLMESADDRTIQITKRAFKKLFDRLYWIPHAVADRIWWTRVGDGFTNTNEEGQAAPRILVRCHPPVWQPSN